MTRADRRYDAHLTREQVQALVQDDRVHRDLYISPELFAQEQQHLFANTWNFVGHASQVPQTGDYVMVTIAGQPLLMVRQADGSVGVLHNRCAHKGAQLVTAPTGNVGRVFRCPYHSWCRYEVATRGQDCRPVRRPKAYRRCAMSASTAISCSRV